MNLEKLQIQRLNIIITKLNKYHESRKLQIQRLNILKTLKLRVQHLYTYSNSTVQYKLLFTLAMPGNKTIVLQILTKNIIYLHRQENKNLVKDFDI